MTAHRRQSGMHMQRNSDLRLAMFVAACASLAAGLIHLSATPGHWQEWWASGVFFAGIALFQIVWAGAVLWRARQGLLGVGVVANLASIALWAVSRRWGIPSGPHASVPEAVGAADVITVVLEATVVAAAVWALLPRRQPALFPTGVFRSVAVAAALVMAGLLVPGVISGLAHDHGEDGHSDHGHGDQVDRKDSDQSRKPRRKRDGDTSRQQDRGNGGGQAEPEGHSDEGSHSDDAHSH